MVCPSDVPDTVLGTWDSSVDTKILTQYNLHEKDLLKKRVETDNMKRVEMITFPGL